MYAVSLTPQFGIRPKKPKKLGLQVVGGMAQSGLLPRKPRMSDPPGPLTLWEQSFPRGEVDLCFLLLLLEIVFSFSGLADHCRASSLRVGQDSAEETETSLSVFSGWRCREAATRLAAFSCRDWGCLIRLRQSYT